MDEQLLTLSGLKFQQLEQPRWWWYLVGLYQDEISRQGYEKREWLFWQVQRGRSKENTLKIRKINVMFPWRTQGAITYLSDHGNWSSG